MPVDTLDLIDEWGPEKVVCVSDRKSRMKGVLVIDNTARGTGKGGTRMSPTLSVEEVARLARNMTWKWAACDLFHGGAKAGIHCDPRSPHKERILRAFARALTNEVPAEYVFGLDMGMSELDAAIFVDELRDRGVAVGLPRSLGGLPYDELGVTGFGVAEATDAAAQEIDMTVRDARIAIQGFGAVGQAAAARLTELGGVVTAISTVAGAVVDPNGLDAARLIELRAAHGDNCVIEYGGQVDVAAVLSCDADILISAAREDVIDKEVALSTQVRLVVEGANLPTTPAAKQILFERGVAVLPDFIANAGGIVAAAHSMDARHSPFPVEPSVVMSMVSRKLRANASAVTSASRSRSLPAHEAADAMARDRVRKAMAVRGQL